jgi:predicted PurR-regulated permease PerM
VIVIFAGLYAIQFLTGNYFELFITGQSLRISPFVMLVSFFFWGLLWGIPGAFIGLPATIAIFTILDLNLSTRWIARLLSVWASREHDLNDPACTTARNFNFAESCAALKIVVSRCTEMT